jgi:hypothetical protein
MSEMRSAVQHCPFCADEDLHPFADPAGEVKNAWECRSCLRVFSVKLHGLARTRSDAQ